mmetsp:Transcript_15532/g.22295  ORF Transcript_15532/g.22295 Transcript_15532/m.22295 type:complete len:171 (+) Transcript_15532:642-1154(+)
MLYNLNIVGLAFTSSQGVFLMLVYLRLEGNEATTDDDAPEVKVESREGGTGVTKLTVADIREAAMHAKLKRTIREPKKYAFSIFDGSVDESSPWAQFLNMDDESEDELENGDGERTVRSSVNSNLHPVKEAMCEEEYENGDVELRPLSPKSTFSSLHENLTSDTDDNHAD